MSTRTRFAPSPTGVLHLGSVRTALFCWLYARHCGGQFVLRIEDTDRERSTEENVAAIVDGLQWLDIDADEGPVFQTARFERYREVVDAWLKDGKAYHCYCTRDELGALRDRQIAAGEKSRYDGRCRDGAKPRPGVDPVVRFKNPQNGKVVVEDLVRGSVTFDNAELDDLIILRSDGTPTYNFTVVVDDSDMRISHVIRGDDHLNNTPRQINMFNALDAEPPQFAHLPMILGTDGAKLSKRHGAVDIRDYREEGYLPQAMLNYLVRLGWSHGDQEFFSIAEMIELFDIADVNQSAAAFDPQKLRWLNQQHIIASKPEVLGEQLRPFLEREGYTLSAGPAASEVAVGFKERAETLKDMAQSCRYCFEDFADFDPAAAKKHLRPVVLEPLRGVCAALRELAEWERASIDAEIRAAAERHDIKLGKIGQPIRVAVTGGAVSPPLDVTLWLVGQERTIARLERAIAAVEVRAAG